MAHAQSVSRALRKAGWMPTPPHSYEGIHVQTSIVGLAYVSTDWPTDRRSARESAQAETVLNDLGYATERMSPTTFYVISKES
jgi:hypothetical protein